MRRPSAIFLIIAALVAEPIWATTKIAPPDIQSLSTTWSGWDESGYTFFRLVLHADGTGFLAYKDTRSLVRCRVRHWSLAGTKLTGELVPIDDTGEAMTIHGRAWRHKLSLTLTAKGFTGTRRVSFTALRESATQEFTRELTERMSQP